MVRIGICDDEKEVQKEIERLCKNRQGITVYCFDNAQAVLEIKEKLDILFLDIELGGMDGILLKDILEEKEIVTMIVFVTSHKEVMEQAFGKKTRGFLVKPIVEKRFYTILDKCMKEVEYVYPIMFSDGSKITSNDIFYIQSVQNYTKLYIENEEQLLRKTLQEWENVLIEYGFVRIHKSYLVNMGKIECCEHNIILENGVQLPIGRAYKKKVMASYIAFIGRLGR